MPTEVTYPEYDELFLMYNQLRRRLDTSLKKYDLTLTGLQILTLIEQAKEQRCPTTRSRIAVALGLTDSTLSTAIKGLTSKGFIREKSAAYEGVRNQPLLLERAGRTAMYKGLVARGDVLEKFETYLRPAQRTAFFKAVSTINRSIEIEVVEARKTKYLKSLSKHHSKKVVRETDWLKTFGSDQV